jgi:hypothetical protein
MMGIKVEHFDLTWRNFLVLSAETPVDQAITEAYTEAGARIVPCAFPSSSALASRQM